MRFANHLLDLRLAKQMLHQIAGKNKIDRVIGKRQLFADALLQIFDSGLRQNLAAFGIQVHADLAAAIHMSQEFAEAAAEIEHDVVGLTHRWKKLPTKSVQIRSRIWFSRAVKRR